MLQGQRIYICPVNLLDRVIVFFLIALVCFKKKYVITFFTPIS